MTSFLNCSGEEKENEFRSYWGNSLTKWRSKYGKWRLMFGAAVYRSPGTPASTMGCLGSSPSCLWFKLPANAFWKEARDDSSNTWVHVKQETCIELQVHGFRLAQPQQLWVSREWSNGWKISDSVSTFQINTNFLKIYIGSGRRRQLSGLNNYIS